MRARLVISVLVVMALVWGVLIGWGYLVRRANAQLRALPGMVDDALRSSVGASEVGRRSATYQLGTNRQVTIENPDGSIGVTAGGSQVVVEGVIRAIGNSHAAAASKASSIHLVESRAPDGGLTLTVVRDKGVRNVWMDLKVQASPDVQLHLKGGSGNMQAAGLRGPVAVEVGSGNITARNLEGRADLSTGSGNIVAEGARGGIAAETDSGNLNLSDVAGEARACTGSGNIDLDFTSSRTVSASTGSGNVRVRARRPFSGTLEAKTDSGEVIVSLPPGSDCRVRATTRSGLVISTMLFAEASHKQDRLSGRLGAGRGSVVASSGAGNIVLAGRS